MWNVNNDVFKPKWPHISLGYIGISSENSTLNSKFFSKIIKNIKFLDSLLIFPQRVPKIGYFEELISLEGKNFEQYFINTIQNIKSNIRGKNFSNNVLINSLKLLMRYGCSEYIVNISFHNKLVDSVFLEVNFLKICSEIQIDLSRERKPDLSQLAVFSNKLILNYNCSPHFKILVLNRIIVNYFRYGCNDQLIVPIEKYVSIVLDNIRKLDVNLINDRFLLAYSYRGLAMSETLSMKDREKFILSSEKLSRSLYSKSAIEHIVYQENLYTTLQTLAKYAINHKRLDVATNYFKEMIDLDPVDCTAYSELALLFLDEENYTEAAIFFEKAKLLGPPGIGMNAYYEAKCYEYLGDTNKYVFLLGESKKYDPYAISPWLDLFSYYKNINNLDEVIYIARKILNNDILLDQLTIDEKKEIIKNANTI